MCFKTLEMQSQTPSSPPPPLPPARDLSLGPPPRWIAPPRKMSWLRASDFEAYRAPGSIPTKKLSFDAFSLK